jgi:hypothetical protein
MGADPDPEMNVEDLLALPVDWEATGDAEHPYRCAIGGTQYALRVNDFPAEPLYSVLADGTVLGDIEDWPSTWRRPAMPANLRRVADSEMRRIAARDGRDPVDLARIAQWTQQLCVLAASDVADVVAALGIPGAVEHQTSGSAVVTPSPLGTLRVSIGKTGGAFSDIEVVLAASAATRRDFDVRFGAGHPVPAVYPGRPPEIAYRITSPDTRQSVTLFGRFVSAQDEAVVLSVLLRRDNAPTSGHR